jgi:hypothetical protein
MSSSSYLEVLEVIRISRPVHLGEEVLVQHFAQQFKQVDLALVVRLQRALSAVHQSGKKREREAH